MNRFWWSIVHAFAWVVVRVYYRTFDVSGRSHVPAEGPILVVVNHPNSLFDAAALILAIGRPVRIGAKEPLFRMKVLGPLLRRLGGIPIHRKQDAGADPSRNQATYRAYVDGLHAGEVCAIFPEGTTHVEPALQHIKAGAARIAVQAEEERDGQLGLAVLPVGLMYRPVQAFRGAAYVRIGEPFSVGKDSKQPRDVSIPAVQARMRERMSPLMVHLDRVDLAPMVSDIARIWDAYQHHDNASGPHAARADIERMAGQCLNHFLATDPDLVEAVGARLDTYRLHAEDAGIGKHSLELRERPFHWTAEFVGLCLRVILGLPIFLIGVLTAYVPARITDHLARGLAEREGDAALPLMRVLVGGMAFGAFWAPLAWLFHGWSGSWMVTSIFMALVAASALATSGYRRRVTAMRRRFFALAPNFVRKRALSRAVAARTRLLWLLQESLLRYEAETGRTILPTEEVRLRHAELGQRRSIRLRRLAVVGVGLLALALLADPTPTNVERLAAKPSPWLETLEPVRESQLNADAAALHGYLQVLRDVDARQTKLRDEFRAGTRDYYAPADSNAIQAAVAEYLRGQEGLLRLAWFYRETPPDRRSDVQAKAFLIAHTAIVELCARGMQFVETFEDDADARGKLNEGDRDRDIPPRLFDSVRENLADPTSLSLLSEGVAHFDTLRDQGALPTGEPWEGLAVEAERGADVVATLSERIASYDLRSTMRKALRRGDQSRYTVSALVSTWIGDARVKKREGSPGLISDAQVEELRARLQPGDILIERRNWYLSNAFLPGFWPHSALYLGGAAGMRELGIADDPRVAKHMDALASPDAHGAQLVVIEAVSEGVIFTSLEHSIGEADAVCVLRPNLPPDVIAEAVAKALAQQGKPYDFDFDFFSADALVCTEVLFQAYGDVIEIEPVEIAGRRTLPALEFVRAWADDREGDTPRYTLIAFLDHHEATNEAIEGDADALVATLDRPGITLLGKEDGRVRIFSLPMLLLAALAGFAILLPRLRRAR